MYLFKFGISYLIFMLVYKGVHNAQIHSNGDRIMEGVVHPATPYACVGVGLDFVPLAPD